MTVIDRLLREWSFRCHDGIVDLNDPNKVKVLEEMISNNELIDLFNDMDNEDKAKIIGKIKSLSKRKHGDIITKLNQKKLNKISKIIVDFAEASEKKGENKEDDHIFELANCLESGMTLDSLGNSGNLISKLKSKGFSETFSKNLIDLTYTEEGKAIGKGEVALIILLNGAEKSKPGDVKIDNKTIEVKSERSKMVLRSVGENTVEKINKYIGQLLDNLFENDDEIKKSIEEKIANVKGWPNKLSVIYSQYNDKNKFEEELQKFLEKIYDRDFVADLDKNELDLSNVNKFKKEITKKLAKEYTDEVKYDNIVFIDNNANYKIFNRENIIDSIEKEEIKIAELSDALPRLSYNIKQPVQEELTLEEILFSLRAK
jgi:hypothetical protein